MYRRARPREYSTAQFLSTKSPHMSSTCAHSCRHSSCSSRDCPRQVRKVVRSTRTRIGHCNLHAHHAQTYASPPSAAALVHARLHECSLSRTFAAADTRAARRHATPRRCAFPEAGREWAREGSADRTPLPAKRCTRLQALQLAPVPVGADHHQRRARRGSRQRLHLFTRARCEELPSSVAPRRSARESTVAPPA